MTQEEYEQKKRECWEEYFKHVVCGTDSHECWFNKIFDRAYALGKQESKPDTVIQGWVARDSNESLYLFCLKPERVRYFRSSDGVWMSRTVKKLDPSLFPDLTWESDPEPVEIQIKRKKNG